MPRQANRKAQAAELRLRGHAKKPAGAPADRAPEVERLVDYLAKRIDRRTPEGKALRKMLPQIVENGISVRQLQAIQVTRLFAVLKDARQKKLDPMRAEIQVGKITEELRKLAEADRRPDETVPSHVTVTINRPVPPDSAGDIITVRAVRGAEPAAQADPNEADCA